MKQELICDYCNGKRFFRRRASFKTKREISWECYKCGSWITIVYEKGLRHKIPSRLLWN